MRRHLPRPRACPDSCGSRVDALPHDFHTTSTRLTRLCCAVWLCGPQAADSRARTGEGGEGEGAAADRVRRHAASTRHCHTTLPHDIATRHCHTTFPHDLISYHIISYHITSCPVLSCPVLSYPVLSSPVLSYQIIHTTFPHDFSTRLFHTTLPHDFATRLFHTTNASVLCCAAVRPAGS